MVLTAPPSQHLTAELHRTLPELRTAVGIGPDLSQCTVVSDRGGYTAPPRWTSPPRTAPLSSDQRAVFDAVRIPLIEIGEAMKALPENLLSLELDLPWSEIACMREHLAHRNFDTTHAIVAATIDHDLPYRELTPRGGPTGHRTEGQPRRRPTPWSAPMLRWPGSPCWSPPPSLWRSAADHRVAATHGSTSMRSRTSTAWNAEWRCASCGLSHLQW